MSERDMKNEKEMTVKHGRSNPEPEQHTPLSEVQPSFGPSDVHVLLADDEKLSRMIISRLLSRCGYRVTVVQSGQEALDLVRSRMSDFQLILSDVAMPGLSGPELLRTIRASRGLHALPVVMMSAHEQAGTVFECIRRGAEDYLLKPISIKEVRNLWQHVYRRRCGLKAVCELPAIPPQPSSAFAHAPADGVEQHNPTGNAAAPASAADSADAPAYTVSDGEPASVATAEDDDEDSQLYTADEMRAHCKRQIERYQKVLDVINNHPELFPAKRHDAQQMRKPFDRVKRVHADDDNGQCKLHCDNEREYKRHRSAKDDA